MKKRFLKTKPVCKVTFELPPEAANGASKVALAGDFNDWDTKATLMKRRKDGYFSITLDLPAKPSSPTWSRPATCRTPSACPRSL